LYEGTLTADAPVIRSTTGLDVQVIPVPKTVYLYAYAPPIGDAPVQLHAPVPFTQPWAIEVPEKGAK
jgi:hypothetical protein